MDGAGAAREVVVPHCDVVDAATAIVERSRRDRMPALRGGSLVEPQHVRSGTRREVLPQGIDSLCGREGVPIQVIDVLVRHVARDRPGHCRRPRRAVRRAEGTADRRKPNRAVEYLRDGARNTEAVSAVHALVEHLPRRFGFERWNTRAHAIGTGLITEHRPHVVRGQVDWILVRHVEEDGVSTIRICVRAIGVVHEVETVNLRVESTLRDQGALRNPLRRCVVEHSGLEYLLNKRSWSSRIGGRDDPGCACSACGYENSGGSNSNQDADVSPNALLHVSDLFG